MREELQILRGLAADYRRLAAQQRDDLDAANALAAAPGEDRVAAALRAFVAEQPRVAERPRPAAWTRRPWLLAAAGAALAIGIGWWATRPPADVLPTTLGRSPDGLSPSGEVAAFTEFAWTTASAPGRTFMLEIVEANTGREVLTREGLVASPWQPTAAEGAGLPDDIRWSLRIRDADDTETTLTTRATRRR